MFDMYVKCNRCQWRKNIIDDFTRGFVNIRWLIEILGRGCGHCNNHDELLIEVEAKKKEN